MPPTLVVVSGPPGTGKTTLAHELARAVGCPAVCRDEIKEGMAHAFGDFEPAPGDVLTQRTLPVFFAVQRLLLECGVSVVAEAAFQDGVWRPNLELLTEVASLRIVQCYADREVALERIADHARSRTAHADAQLLDAIASGRASIETFERVALDVPTIDVDTTSGYRPALDEVVAFLNGS